MRIYLAIDNKELDIELDGSTQLETLSIIASVFQLMGVQDSLSEMVDDYIKIGKAYRQFYSQVDNIEPSDKEPLQLDLKYPKGDSDSNDNVPADDRPDHYKSGIIEEDNEVKKYKCRLHCACGNNQNVYIEPDNKHVDCPICHKVHKVRNAKKEGFPARDSWGNYFIAGAFVGEDEITE